MHVSPTTKALTGKMIRKKKERRNGREEKEKGELKKKERGRVKEWNKGYLESPLSSLMVESSVALCRCQVALPA